MVRCAASCLFMLFVSLVICSENGSECFESQDIELNGASGEFGCSPYGDNVNSSWKILLDEDGAENMILEFTMFDTEGNYDFVTIRDGPDYESPVLGSFSGSFVPGPFISSGNSLFITFVTDPLVEGNGFSAQWTSFSQGQGNVSSCLTSDNVELSGGEGTFGCDGYGNGVTVNFHISSNPGEQPVLDFQSFSTEQNFDILNIYDGPSTTSDLIGTFSGNTIPLPITATGSDLYLSFVSDYSISYSGFTASWTSLVSFSDPCYNSTALTLVAHSGFVGCNVGYGNNVNTTWTIRILGDYVISFEFYSLEVEEQYDFVDIFDGSSTDAPMLASYSGHLIPQNAIISSGNSMVVMLRTDASGTGSGFTGLYDSFHALQPAGCSTSGSFVLAESQDSFGCEGYYNGVIEEWIIQTEGKGQVISLQWLSFDITSNDILSIYDGGSETSPLIYSVSGNTIPDPVVSTNQELLVKFTAFASNNVRGSGFSAVYESIFSTDDTCNSSGNHVLTEATGSFGCDGYANGIEISWEIDAASGFVINLDFDSFLTESVNDVLTIYDGRNDRADVIGSWSGQFRPPTILSSSSYLYITFITNQEHTSTGFSAVYNSVFTGSGAGSCEESDAHFLAETEGSFGCTGYADEITVSWLISTISGIISLEFTEFGTEPIYDTVSVYDGENSGAPLIGQYSGYFIPPAILSSGTKLYVIFHSDKDLTDIGFHASYHSISDLAACTSSVENTLSGSYGEFGCDGYVNGIEIGWTISIRTGQQILLRFISFDTEQFYDYVQLYDGPNSSSPSLGTFSGDILPGVITSSSNQFYVHFHSDSSSSDFEGFTMTYEGFGSQENYCTTSRLHNIHSSFGYLGCNNYVDNIRVSWNITATAIIFFSFESFSTEIGYDIVSLYDGPSTDYPLLGSFSGNSIPGYIISSDIYLFVQFISDSSNSNYPGFTADFASNRKDGALDDIRVEITEN